MEPRIEKIHELIAASSRAMEPLAEGCTPAEVLSAYFTMARNAVVIAKRMGVPGDACRAVVEMILLECNDEGRTM